MKKIITLFLGVIIFSSCLNTNNDEINFDFTLLPIDEYKIPASFTFGVRDTIEVKYTLPDGCHSFNNLYYEVNDTNRIVGIRALVELDKDCTEAAEQKEYKIIIIPNQTEDYLFKFWKGRDSNGENIFEDVIVPVN